MPRGRPKKNKDLELATLVQENTDISNQEVEILPVDEVEIMSMSQLQQEKQELAQRRSQVLLKLDKRRIKQAEKIMDAMDLALDRMIGCYDEDGQMVEVSPMDFKFLTEGYKNLMNSYNMVTRLDSVDIGGKAGSVELRLETPDGSVYGKVEW